MTDLAAQPYQVMPPLTAEEQHALRQSIEKNGVLEAVVFDEDGEILDGHHRVAIAEELGIEYTRRVLVGLDHAAKLRYAITTNAVRRQLAPAQVSSMIANLRIKCGMSIRGIADELGLPKSTVADRLAQVSGSGHLPEAITGKDNKTYAATRPTQSPGSVDTTTSPADPGASPAPATFSPSAPAREPNQTPEPAAAPSTAPAGPGSGEAVAPTREGGATATPDQDEVDLQAWRLNFSKALTAAFRVPLFEPAHVAEKADPECIDQLRRLRASIEDYANRVDAALAASMPDNVRQIRRTS